MQGLRSRIAEASGIGPESPACARPPSLATDRPALRCPSESEDQKSCDRAACVAASEQEPGAPWTISDVLRWAREDFEKRGLESPRLEAEVLLCHVLQVDRVRLVIDAQRPLEPGELSAYRNAIKRRRTGEPTAYIMGHREFFGRKFCVDSRVLIPRPDTEMLVEEALERTAHRPLFGRALDLCTGSGCVAISFASRRPTWRVTGSDISADAIDVARKNAVLNGAIWGMRWCIGNLFEAVGEKERFELVIANPPYIPNGEVVELETTVRDFEPHGALDGGNDGLDSIRQIVAQAPARLVTGGVLALEVGAGQSDEVARIFADLGFDDLQRRRDYGGHERVISGRWTG